MKFYSEKKIAQNSYIQLSYKDLIRAAKRGDSIKDVKWVDDNLKMQFLGMTNEEIVAFDNEVIRISNELDIRNQIRIARNQISNKEIVIKSLEKKLKEIIK